METIQTTALPEADSKKVKAIVDLTKESHKKELSLAGAKRVLRACKALGLDDTETRKVFVYLDYCGPDGNPWNDRVERVWP